MPVNFATVLQDELEHIDRRRLLGLGELPTDRSPGPVDSLEVAEQKAHDRQLVGLAFSGGGIRSATFNLGVLQGLAQLGLLPFIDYLSTVSGGGYIGSWFASWVNREKGGLVKVQKQLRNNGQESTSDGGKGAQVPLASAPKNDPTPSLTVPTSSLERQTPEPGMRGEPDAIRHLRCYSNYLAPRHGFLSADNWVLVAGYLRNMLLCQLVLLPTVVAVLLVPRFVMVLYFPWQGWRAPGRYVYGVAASAVCLWLVAFVLLFRAVFIGWRTRQEDRVGPKGVWLILALFSFGAIVFCLIVPYPLYFIDGGRPWWDSWRFAWLLHTRCFISTGDAEWLALLTAFAGTTAILVSISYFIAACLRWSDFWAEKRRAATVGFVVFVAGLFLGGLLYAAYHLLQGLCHPADDLLNRDYLWVRGTARLVTLGPPIVLVTLFLAFCLAQGMLKRQIDEARREWWANVCGRLLMIASGWVALHFVSLYGTSLVLWAGSWAQASLVSGWLLTVGCGVFTAFGPRTGPARPKNTLLDWFVRVTPSVFLVGFLILVSILIHTIIDKTPLWERASDTVWSRSVVPERPTRRVNEISVRTENEAEKREPVRTEVERAEVVNDAEIVAQMYWLGILNSDPEHVPFDRYWLSSKYDLPQLRKYGVLNPKFHLCLIYSPADAGGIPNEVQNQIPVAEVNNLMHVRIFDSGGQKVVQFPDHAGSINDLRERFHRFQPPNKLTTSEEAQIVSSVLSIVGHPLSSKAIFEVELYKRGLVIDDASGGNPLIGIANKGLSREEFLKRLDECLPAGTPYNHRFWILQRAKNVQSIKAEPINLLLKLSLWLLACLGLIGFAAWRIDVNLFSLHALYGNRLVRAYLGASNARPRLPDPLTGFDPDDDMPLADLLIGNDNHARYDGPFIIINAARNLVHGDRLDWQERKSESFALTPLYCGSQDPNPTRKREPTYGYCSTPPGYECELQLIFSLNDVSSIPTAGKSQIIVAEVNNLLYFRLFDPQNKTVVDTNENLLPEYVRPRIVTFRKTLQQFRPPFELSKIRISEKRQVIADVASIVDYTPSYAGNVSVGAAMTISGAAASPNMGYYSSPFVTALLTVFNARLGAWLGNPASLDRWHKAGPVFGLVHLLWELFGFTQATGEYVYLSDGGHFENLGGYELIRRRCRYVLLFDADADRKHTFENLGNLIQKCRVDFGIRLEIDLDSMRLEQSGRCRSHCAVGQIHYEDADPGADTGILVFIKPSITGDESADILEYRERHTDFPHQTTFDQFFTESQFESYRALGKHIVEAVFEQSKKEMDGAIGAETNSRQLCEVLFSSLANRWRMNGRWEDRPQLERYESMARYSLVVSPAGVSSSIQ